MTPPRSVRCFELCGQRTTAGSSPFGLLSHSEALASQVQSDFPPFAPQGVTAALSEAEKMCFKEREGSCPQDKYNGEDTNLVRLTGLEKQPSIFLL